MARHLSMASKRRQPKPQRQAARKPQAPLPPPPDEVRTGRPTKLTPDVAQAILRAIRAGSYLEEAAAAVGVAQSTLYLWLQKGREGVDAQHIAFSEAVERARAEDAVRDLALISSAAGRPVGDLDWRAAAWKRERKDPAKWGVKVRVTVTEELEGVLDDLQRVLPPEWYEKALEALAARLGGETTGGPEGVAAEGGDAPPAAG